MAKKKTRDFLFIGLILLGCESNNITPNQSQPGDNISLHQNESILITEVPLHVTVLTISDSRCPVDVECFWAGQASADFKIDGITFQLLVGQAKEFDIPGKHLKITLIDVIPYPTTTNGNEKKSAVLVIERL